MRLLLLIAILSCAFADAQIPAHRFGKWKHIAEFDTSFLPLTVHVDDFNNGTSQYLDSSLNKAIQYVSAQGGGTVLICPGVYTLKKPVNLASHVKVKGSGKSTEIHLKFGTNTWNGFELKGRTVQKNIGYDSIRGNVIFLKTPLSDTSVRLIKFSYNDSHLMNNDWAYGSAGQLLAIKSINNKIVILEDSVNLTEAKDKNIVFISIAPIQHAAVECIYIIRDDSANGQASNISLELAYNCQITGVESNLCNFAHINVYNSTGCIIQRNYLHHSFGYGGGGQGYGIVLQYGAYRNLIRDNVLKHLRHSILLQSGANNNVIAYNYSIDPFVTDNIFQDAGGDLVCHGNYPYLNLFEGNVCQTLIIDNSHGKNGPYNTFFRNRMELYGVIVSANQDSQNFIANEVTNTGSLKGQFAINGSGHFRYANNIKNSITDGGSYTFPNSLYLNALPDFWVIPYKFWGIGPPFQYNQGSNPAHSRFKDSNEITICEIPLKTSSIKNLTKNNLFVYPNPLQIGSTLYISKFCTKAELFNSEGMKLGDFYNFNSLPISHLPTGLYILLINSISYKFIITES